MSEPTFTQPEFLTEDQKRLTRNQREFLRKLREHPHGLPLTAWPRATTWRHWLRRPRFAAAIQSLRDAFHEESQLLLAGSAAQAAYHIQSVLSGGIAEDSGMGIAPHDIEHSYHKTLKSLTKILKVELQRRVAAQKYHQQTAKVQP
jgi:hypothetical protein